MERIFSEITFSERDVVNMSTEYKEHAIKNGFISSVVTHAYNEKFIERIEIENPDGSLTVRLILKVVEVDKDASK